MQVEEAASNERKRWINYETIPYKIHYFFLYGVYSGIKPMLIVSVMLKHQISGTTIALILVGATFLTVFTKPAISAIADYLNKIKLIIIVLIVLETLFMSSLAVIGISGKDGIDDDPKEYDDRFSTSFTIHCNSFVQSTGYNSKLKANKTSCHIRESICRSHFLLNETESMELIQVLSAYDRSRICIEHGFHCCQEDSQYSPQSMRLDFLRCSRHISGSFYGFGDASYCFPFALTEYDENIAKLQGHFYDEKVTSVSTAVVHGTNSLCFNAKSPDGVSSVDNKSQIFLFLTNEEKMSFFTCHRDERQFDCGALDDLLSIQYPENELTNCEDDAKPQKEHEICLIVILCTGVVVCLESIITLSDTICQEASHKYGQEFGKQRLWGSIGEGIMSLLEMSLYLFSIFETSEIAGFFIAFLIFLCISSFVEIANIIRLDLRKPKPPSDGFRRVYKLFGKMEFVMFNIGVLVVGFFSGANYRFLLSFMENIGNSYIIIIYLLYLTRSLFGELPFMYFSGSIIYKIGYTNVLVITFLGYAVKFLWYSFLINPWWFLPIEIIDGFCFGVFYVAMTTFAKSKSPEGMEATTQSILSCTFSGLGEGLGFIVTEILYSNRMEMKTGFLNCAFFGVVAAVVLYCISQLTKIRAKSKRAQSDPRNQNNEITIVEETDARK